MGARACATRCHGIETLFGARTGLTLHVESGELFLTKGVDLDAIIEGRLTQVASAGIATEEGCAKLRSCFD